MHAYLVQYNCNILQPSILAGVAVESNGTRAPDPVGEDAGYQIEYVEEEIEEEPPTDDETVEVSGHDQNADILKSVAKPLHGTDLPAKPEEPKTPEDCKKEFLKGTFQDWYLNHCSSLDLCFI